MASRRVLRHPLPRILVKRPRLEARLDRVPPGGLGLLVASAGSGKSVLVGGWMRGRAHQRVAALTVEAHHDDAVVLARDLLAALREAAPELPAELAGRVVSGGATFGDTFVTDLLAALDRLTGDLVLVVEDAHLLTNRSVRDDLGRILTALPDSTRALVTTRRDLGWPVRDLRLTGRLVELRGADLALDAAEARELLVGVSERELTDADVERLLDRTDGWVAGLQLAAISLQNVPDVACAVQNFAGSDRLVADYLLEEVIEQQEPEVRRFLLETSVLEWLSADVCDAVTGHGNARRLLAELDQRSLFLIPLDRSGEVFRYHHLFADLLRYRLRVEQPEAAAPLRARAGDWLLRHGNLEEGIDQLLAAGEHARALDVIATSGHLLFHRGECATLVRWLSAVHDADPAPSVRLGINLMAAQMAADQSEAAAETYRHLLRRGDLAPGERVAIDTLFAFMVFRGLPPETVLAVAARVLAALPEVGESRVVDFLGLGGLDSVQAMATYASGVAELLRGEVPTAAATLEHLLTLPGGTYPIWRIYALGTLALAKAWLGQPGEALRLAEAALKSAGSIIVPTHWAMTHAHLAAALAHLDRLELEPAARALAHADLQNRLRPSSVVNHDLQRLIAARLAALQEGPAQALELLATPAEAPLEAPALAR
ncbi:MAG TPA: hypothetical protein PLP61_10540, partial [Nocardioides sp.]|nr:hypothetical protein [Nocardioides sp.]